MKAGRPLINAHLNCAGAYGIRERENKQYHYIGCAKNIKTRWRYHRTATTRKEYNDEFHKDLRAHPDKYECVVLEEYKGKLRKGNKDIYEKLVPIECKYIRKYKALGHPLVTTEENNLCTRKHTDEEKTKMRENHADESGKNNPMFGTRWMHKPNERPIPVKQCDIKQRLDEGYIFGRK